VLLGHVERAEQKIEDGQVHRVVGVDRRLVRAVVPVIELRRGEQMLIAPSATATSPLMRP
jgi:hypothetical protein